MRLARQVALHMLAGVLVGQICLGQEAPRRLTTHPAEDRAPSWSPTGDRLLFASNRDGNYEIYSIGADGKEIRRLTNDPAEDRSPSWSPDGERFVFESDRDGPNGLWIYDFADGETELLLSDPSPELVPDWSPDGEWIAFTSERSGNLELYRVSVHNGSIERLTDDEYRDVWPRYSADGRRLVFFSRRSTAGRSDDLFLLDLETRSISQVTDHPAHHDFVPDFAPDGMRIVAGMSDRDAGLRALEIHHLDGNSVNRLVADYHRVFHPAWSPDGQWIAYAARAVEGESADIYLINAAD